jgi:hypothetical protein
MLARVDETVVQQLVIKCDTRLSILNEESVELISRMRKLTSLKVYLARGLPEQLAIELLTNLSHLQELVLAEFVDLTPGLMEVIKTYNPNLTRICFSYDMQSLKSAEEALEFLPDIPEGLRSESYWQSLTDSGLMLTNLELQNASYHGYWVNYIRNSTDILR